METELLTHEMNESTSVRLTAQLYDTLHGDSLKMHSINSKVKLVRAASVAKLAKRK